MSQNLNWLSNNLTVSQGEETKEFEVVCELVESHNARGEQPNDVEAVEDDPGKAEPPPPEIGMIVRYSTVQ